MIKIEYRNELQGADKFGDCINCGSIDDVFKITFSSEENTQQHGFRICGDCMRKLAILLNDQILKDGD